MIAEIRLQQYRSYLNKTFTLSSGVNIVVGPNASGKTNLLEAIMVVCEGGSYRAPDNDLIMHSVEWARIDASGDFGQRTLKLTNQPLNKEFVINDKPLKRLGPKTRLPVVLFEPNHLLMLSGPPVLRRDYLDGILDLINPHYKKTKNAYLRTLRQRNALLKTGSTNTNQLFPWDVRLSHLGGFMAASRAELISELNKSINVVYASLTEGTDNVSLSYKAGVSIESYESSLLKKLESSLGLDLLRGFTAYGPHREDMEVLINNRPPSLVASRGESRSITISLKIIEAEIIKKVLGTEPIILMDDVFSELDKQRSALMVDFLRSDQVVITTAELTKVHTQKKDTNIIRI